MNARRVTSKVRRALVLPFEKLREHERRKADKIAELEQRVAALEVALKKCPGETCLYCGERSMRLKKSSGLVGSGRGTWRRETWVCEACGKEDWRHRNYLD